MTGYRYFDGGDAHFCFASAPTFECPAGALEVGDPKLELVALDLGVRPEWLARRLGHGATRARDRGKLTTLCTCGHRLKSLGWSAWVERPNQADDDAARLNRIFGDGFVQDGRRRYFDTRREAREWALEEFRTHRAAAEEASA